MTHETEKMPKATLVSSEHGFDDYDVEGIPTVHRVTIGHGIRKGDHFNVYCHEGRKIGGVWQGTLEKSLERLKARLAAESAEQKLTEPHENDECRPGAVGFDWATPGGIESPNVVLEVSRDAVRVFMPSRNTDKTMARSLWLSHLQMKDVISREREIQGQSGANPVLLQAYERAVRDAERAASLVPAILKRYGVDAYEATCHAGRAIAAKLLQNGAIVKVRRPYALIADKGDLGVVVDGPEAMGGHAGSPVLVTVRGYVVIDASDVEPTGRSLDGASFDTCNSARLSGTLEQALVDGKLPETPPQKRDIELCILGAQTHGECDDPDHEVGDLQDCLREMWELMTPAQQQEFMASDSVRDRLEHNLPEKIFTTAYPDANEPKGEPTPVRKTVIQFTVLHDDGLDLSSISLRDVAYECDEGGYVGGGLAVVFTEALTRQQIDTEAAKIGADGSFFDIDPEEDSTSAAPSPGM
ncbi:hypothetical protein KDW82_08275 [Burkholderia vietnamiensis]|uniref:hypothetical protein n=1 Tax=Burkholderia vietnamiensis TaxID=60552 RepID=UPI001B9C7FFC|nr:hypothetical protein [Burkholderia vietnamiensis]MBR8189053.1 hypothetical protein [Burkholderia vietnamiensis]